MLGACVSSRKERTGMNCLFEELGEVVEEAEVEK